MVSDEMLIVAALQGNVRVNDANKTVEIYNEYGVCMVLRDLDEVTYEAFKSKFRAF